MTVRAAFYARYSSDQQSAASIEDQFRVCQERAEREGWTVVAHYQDAAISGASLILRPGVRGLLDDARDGKFDVVLAEALDRVSRDQADVATLFKHLQFARVPLVTLSEGEISELHVGLKGTMNALFLKDLANKTRRGLRGRVEKGFAAGSSCYGYRVVRRLTAEGELVRGEREIDEAQAAVINRIFREYAAGKSPKSIARDLNAEGIAGPTKRGWLDAAIRGNPKRGTGILNNVLYVGVRVWNQTHTLKDPRTGRVVSRPNPESEWVRVEVPALRIVPDDLWAVVRRQQAVMAEQHDQTHRRSFHAARRPVHLLSGLMRCGVCGGTVTIVMPGRFGCVSHRRGGSCTNKRTIRRDKLEARVLAGIREKLVSPERVRDAVAAFAAHTNELNRERLVQAEADKAALAKIDKGIAGMIAAIEDGLYQPAMKACMDELQRQKVEIEARQAQAPRPMPDIHPNIADAYRRKVERLTETLRDPDIQLEAVAALRSIIGKVVLTPGPKHGQVHATLHGELIAILDFANDNGQTQAPSTSFMSKVAVGSSPWSAKELGQRLSCRVHCSGYHRAVRRNFKYYIG
ncbi:MAG: recombinase family protein [Gemmobacter sp.]|jgi:DNA invertase Pin-like site-specific DNA recombinase|nr:recombinase family protein [Gemmobacter sp.]